MATFYEIYQNYLKNPYSGVEALPEVNDTGGPFRDGGRVGLYDGGSAFDNYRACCRNLFRIQS
jgi:hypothetical protein